LQYVKSPDFIDVLRRYGFTEPGGGMK
jgi:hypothetical protein